MKSSKSPAKNADIMLNASNNLVLDGGEEKPKNSRSILMLRGDAGIQ